MERSRRSSILFGSIVAGIIVADLITKAVAVAQLVPRYVPRSVIGDWVQFRLVYNQGAAFGISVGSYSRPVFILLTVITVGILYRMYRATAEGDLLRTAAIAMVVGGAIGNLIDRLRSAQGVVDFIDVGVGVHRWPTFNVADMGVSVGAVLLALVLWKEDVPTTEAPAESAPQATPSEPLPGRSS